MGPACHPLAVYPRVDGGTVTYLRYHAYPDGLSRVDGGTATSTVPMRSEVGLSPRGRGNPSNPPVVQNWDGSIPAWTGEPSPSVDALTVVGLSPRGRGNRIGDGVVASGAGLSPRGRGNQELGGEVVDLQRSIPAWTADRGRYLVFPASGR